jgi:RND family efflux transporter MFP subunit
MDDSGAGSAPAPAFGRRAELSGLKKGLPPCFRAKAARRSWGAFFGVLVALVLMGYPVSGGMTAEYAKAVKAEPASIILRPIGRSPTEAVVLVEDANPLGAPPAEGAAETTQLASAANYVPDPPPGADNKYQVQAVLAAKRSAVLSAGIDARIIDYHFKSGDHFNKGETLVEFDCGVDRARLRELQARQALSERQLQAYNKLKKLKTVSDLELETAVANNAQNLAQIEQINQRLILCKIPAPYDGIVMRTMANNYEFSQTGHVLMEIASREPLQAQFLVSSVWLRWLNIGTPVSIYIDESGKKYDASLVRINGEVDPVSQSVQVVAELSSYNEELLPGMSGKATFDTGNSDAADKFGYHGLILEPRAPEKHR